MAISKTGWILVAIGAIWTIGAFVSMPSSMLSPDAMSVNPGYVVGMWVANSLGIVLIIVGVTRKTKPAQTQTQ